MNIQLSERAIEQLSAAPPLVQKAFIEQFNFLARNLGHPWLRAKKYDESDGRWQARVSDDWRFTSLSNVKPAASPRRYLTRNR